MGQLQPQVLPEGQEPRFVADAETQMHVVDLAPKFCVFPRVIGRGDTDLIELPGTLKRFHRENNNIHPVGGTGSYLNINRSPTTAIAEAMATLCMVVNQFRIWGPRQFE
jgi:hypothetical protein